jgi:purine-binding chemotaxis protein CheW
MPSARNLDAILRERARLLARPEWDEHDDTVELAAFRIGGHTIGVPLMHVSRAADLRHLTEIPGGPPHLLGVTAVDGKLVSLLDLTALYGLRGRGLGDVTGTILVAHGRREIALAAEQLIGIEDVPPEAIKPVPGAGSPLSKVATLASHSMLVLDVEALFADARLALER